MAKIIVVGNEKGGSGKTTTTMHLIVSLLKLGFSVGSMDLDSRQQSLTRYVENRAKSKDKFQEDFPCPQHVILNRSENQDLNIATQEEESKFQNALNTLVHNDFIVIDTPGSDAILSRIAHRYADLIITPINDSFIDLDLIGQISADNMESIKPGIYSAMLWEQKMKRASINKKEQDWVVVRNRLSAVDAINKRNMENALTRLSKRFGFRIAPGFGDRVIFKELFLHGLTLHDAKDSKEIKLSASVIAGRQELREFVMALNIPEIMERITQKAA